MQNLRADFEPTIGFEVLPALQHRCRHGAEHEHWISRSFLACGRSAQKFPSASNWRLGNASADLNRVKGQVTDDGR